MTTTEQVQDAWRAAIAIALAAHRDDPDAVAALWRDTANKQQLLWSLARLPAALMQGAAASFDAGYDVERALTDLTEHFAGLGPLTGEDDR